MKGISIGNTTYVWNERIDSVSLALKHTRNRLQKIINGLVFGVMVLLFVVFILNMFVFDDSTILMDWDFWTTPNPTLLVFWLAVFLALFLGYRLTEAKRLKGILPRLESAGVDALTVIDVSSGAHQTSLGAFMDQEAIHAAEEAYKTAITFSHAEVLPLHLFIGSLTTNDAAVIFARLGLSFDSVKDALARKLNTLPATGSAVFGPAVEETILKACLGSLRHRRDQITPVELMMAAYDTDPFLQDLLFSKKIERQDFENVVQWIRITDQLRRRYYEFTHAASFKPKGPVNRAYTSLATPFLDSVSEDLTRSAASGYLPMLVGRQSELNSVFRAIEGGNQSVILVGPPGVGKEAVVAGVAEAMVEERVPRILQDKRLVKISLPHIVSGATGTEAEARLLQALHEIGVSGNIVTVITDIDQMIGSGLDLSAILSQELDRGYTFVIATTTPEGYRTKVEQSVLGQKLIKVPIEEPSTNEAIQILESVVGGMENKNKVLFTYEAIAKIVQLTSRYMHDRYLPEKAIEVAKEVALSVANKKGDRGRVLGEDVAAIISEKTKVPVMDVASDEREKLLHLEDRLHERVIGQDEAVKAISAALRRARAELRSTNRPIANYLFLGPTGVGKTELAKTVAEVYFGSENSMLRFDMSEYQEKTSLERLIGGSGQVGLLTEAVRQNPFSLLLLDELEKAHPDILNLFLQVMDDGRLTDATGRTIDFTNVILIATSNAGAPYIQEAITAGTPIEQIKEQLMETELKTVYRPEFLNRFDGVIVFKPLNLDDVLQIAYLLIDKVAERLKAKGISFRASDEAVDALAKKGFDPKFGARPLRRVIQEEVDNAIANVLLRGDIGRRDTLVLEPGGRMTIEKAAEL